MTMKITEDFTATGTSSENEQAQSGAFVIAGTFVGTVQLQRLVVDVWQPIAEFTAPTAIGDDTSFDNGIPSFVRFECTAFTSGTIECDLAGTRSTVVTRI